RTITLRARPTANATATALRFAGDVSGSPIQSLALGLSGIDYAAPPIVDLSTGTPNRAGTAVARMGVARGIVIAGGPYQVPPTVVITDSGGSGAVISTSLLVASLVLGDPGFGYEAAPTVTFVAFFSSCCPDTEPTSQIAMVINWMTAVFQAALRTPIKSVLPVIA